MFSDQQIARLLDLAGLAITKGMVSQARTICQGVLAAKSDFAPALITTAFSHIVVDDFEKAQEILNGVLEANPKDNDALAMLGMSYALAGDQAQAKQILEKVDDASLPSYVMAQEFMKANL